MCFRHLELFLINIITVNFSEENGRGCKKDKPFWKLLINVLAQGDENTFYCSIDKRMRHKFQNLVQPSPLHT
jgi:hypothetical protein